MVLFSTYLFLNKKILKLRSTYDTGFTFTVVMKSFPSKYIFQMIRTKILNNDVSCEYRKHLQYVLSDIQML